VNANFPTARAFVWQRGLDSPQDGFHTTVGDAGLGTNGGVTQATWDSAVQSGIVTGALSTATTTQLSHVLQIKFWGVLCDELPHGVDLLYFNGLMMTGAFPHLMQQCLGFMGADVDGWIGPESLKVIRSRDPETFIDAVSGCHYQYLTTLAGWATFGNGWTNRLKLAQTAARAMADAAPIA